MAISQRGLRRISVDGRALVWRLRATKCLCCHSHAVVVADASRRGSVIHLSAPDPYRAPVAVAPALIAARVREAIALGWIPGEGHGVFARLAGA